MRKLPLTLASSILAISFGSTACSSSDPGGPSQDGPSTADPGGSLDTPADTASGPCDIDTGYSGDELCLAPPDPSEGIQLHVGPTDYDDPDAVAPYLLEVGGEDVVCFNDLPSDGGFHYYEQTSHMRTGSHHMLIPLEDATGLQEGPDTGCSAFGSLGAVPGSQTPTKEVKNEGLAPEDRGLARWFPEGAMAQFQLHYVNTTTEEVLREAWINIYRMDETDVTGALNSVFMVGDIGVNIPAGTRMIDRLDFTPDLPESTRIFELNGHSHAHSERFAAFVTPSGGEERLIYESYNWEEPMVVRYDTVTDNPMPDPAALSDGGASGTLMLNPGDTLSWECEVNNTLDHDIGFANEAYNAEMCLLAGAYVSDQAGLLAGACINAQCFGGGFSNFGQ